MDQGLKAQIHRYAENREIDYLSAKNLGIAYGIQFANEKELVEFKQTIDRYLKTFQESDFEEIENLIDESCKSSRSYKHKPIITHPDVLKKHSGKKKMSEAYDISSFAKDDDEQMRGGFVPNKKGKKSPGKKVDSKRYKVKDRSQSKRQFGESVSLDDAF